MTVGTARVTLYLHDTQSLKDKRQIVRSLTKRVQNQYNAAIAEVEDLDDLSVATLGIAVISNSTAHTGSMLSDIVSFIERNVEVGTLGEVETEHISL